MSAGRPGDAGLTGTQGFTLVEALVAMGLTLTVLASVFGFLVPARRLFLQVPEAADLDQRGRYLVQTMAHDLRMAGRGESGPGGSFLFGSAPVLPYRAGLSASDARAGVHFRPGVITALYVPSGPEVTRRPLRTGARTVQGISRTYFLRTTATASQLMQYDGLATDAPVLDDVVELAFEYAGEPEPPRVVTLDPTGLPVPPRTTYGPLPPAVGVDDPLDPYPAGENCVFTVDSGVHVPRLPALAGDGGLQPLPPAMLTDGPWCPGTTSGELFDADLLRVRRIHVRARLQARAPFRGAAGPWFSRPGSARLSSVFVPDQEVRFDVAPRNLVSGR